MNLPDAIALAQRFLSDCAASPAHDMPRPSPDERKALAFLIAYSLAVKPNQHATPILDSNDMSGCA